MRSAKRCRIDRFDAPAAARQTFLARIRIADARLAAINDCESHKNHARRLDRNGLAAVTVAQWRQHPRWSRTAPSGARTDGGSSSPRHNICSRSILSAELMKMPVGIADQRFGI
jgi:hypothetical protein